MFLCDIPLVSFCLPQADQLMFAIHFVKGMHPELLQENVSIYCICIKATIDADFKAFFFPETFYLLKS